MVTWDYEDYGHLPMRKRQSLEKQARHQSMKAAYGPLYAKYKSSLGQVVQFRSAVRTLSGTIIWVTSGYVIDALKHPQRRQYFPQYIVESEGHHFHVLS